ncbi:MAG: hypothetical protein ACW98X_23885 [Promethearchaeota archaeon]
MSLPPPVSRLYRCNGSEATACDNCVIADHTAVLDNAPSSSTSIPVLLFADIPSSPKNGFAAVGTICLALDSNKLSNII